MLAQTLADLPKDIDGIDLIERLVIDDGSTDNTVKVAKDNEVEHIISLGRNRGLAEAFSQGLSHALKQGADIIVNTDADNQYYGDDIRKLLEPILSGRAQFVIGRRPISTTKSFSPVKKFLQNWGSKFVSLASGIKVDDAPSGFRAMTQDTALRLNIFSRYTYTLESLVVAGRSGVPIEFVPIRTNPPTRPSRLIGNTASYIVRSVATVVRIFIVYRPFRFFLFIGSVPFAAALFLSLRWLYFQHAQLGGGNTQSLILAAILFIAAFLCAALAVIADLLCMNRKILSEIQYHNRRRDIKLNTHLDPKL